LDKINLDDDVGDETADATSALVAAVKRMARKKKETKKLPELEVEATEFLREMDAAADADEECIANRKPATKKLALLPQVLETLAKKDMQRPLLDLDLLTVTKRWVQPLPNGSLGNVTLRKAIFESISTMTGENGVNSGDLKRSGFGKVTMALYMHKSETPAMKKLLKSLIDGWSRPIFQKSGDMRDLEKIQAARGMNESGSLVGIARSAAAQQKSPGGAKRGKTEDELAEIISKGSKNARDSGNNRVRVPYSKGFQFSVRPTNRTGDVSDKRNLVSAAGRASMGPDGEKRNAISKRMLEKNRPVNKQNQRSANISIEGRVVK
jgi:transcription factor SPN1